MGDEPTLPAGVRELNEAAAAREAESHLPALAGDNDRDAIVELLARMGRDGIVTFVGRDRVPMLRSYGRALLALLPALDDYASERVPDAHAASIRHYMDADDE